MSVAAAAAAALLSPNREIVTVASNQSVRQLWECFAAVSYQVAEYSLWQPHYLTTCCQHAEVAVVAVDPVL